MVFRLSPVDFGKRRAFKACGLTTTIGNLFNDWPAGAGVLEVTNAVAFRLVVKRKWPSLSGIAGRRVLLGASRNGRFVDTIRDIGSAVPSGNLPHK